MTEPAERLSGSQVALVLERAAEIDARGDTVSVDEVGRIAAEAGIDPEAVRIALSEVLAADDPAVHPAVAAAPRPPAVKPSFPSPRRILAGALAGALLGFSFWIPETSGFWMPIVATGPLFLYVGLRAHQAMKRGSQLAYQLQNFALWLAAHFVAGSAPAFHPIENIFAVMVSLWIVTSVLGGLVVRFGPRDASRSEEASGASSSRTTATTAEPRDRSDR